MHVDVGAGRRTEWSMRSQRFKRLGAFLRVEGIKQGMICHLVMLSYHARV